MTMTFDEITANLTEVSTFSAHDDAGLDSLPIGTIVIDRDSDAYLKEDQGRYRELDEGAPAPDAIAAIRANPSAHCSGIARGNSYLLTYGPLLIANPDILAEYDLEQLQATIEGAIKALAGMLGFSLDDEDDDTERLADWERELLAGDAEDALDQDDEEIEVPEPAFKEGDIIEFTGPAHMSNWEGLRAEVLRPTSGFVRLLDGQERPDGSQMREFYWDMEDVRVVRELVSEPIKVGDRVRVTAATYVDLDELSEGVVEYASLDRPIRTYQGVDHPFRVRLDQGGSVFASSVERV